MSRKTILLALAVAGVVLLAVMMVLSTDSGTKVPPEEQQGTELVELPEQKTEDEPAQEEPPSYEFVLRDYHNYVTVYTLPEDTVYEYTDVILDVLPEDIRAEIRQGKYLQNEEELYNFLENYTS